MALSNEQQTFVEAEGKVVLCACPGSGKTFTVAHKLSSYLNAWEDKHQGIAALSFTNVASAEIEKKAKELIGNGANINHPHFIGTIDSFLNQFVFLRYAYLLTNINQRPYITQAYLNTYFNWDRECHKKGCVSKIHEFRWDIDNKFYQNNELVECSYGKKCVKYKKMLIKNNIFYQNDVAYTVYNILKKYPQITKALSDRFPIILLDEAQDTSKEQMAILDLIADAGTKTICLVGDPDQSIYEWRNATASCFTDKMYSKEWHTLFLTENRRSSQKICDATSVFSSMSKDKKSIIAVGDNKNFYQKPQLLLLEKDSTQESVVAYFLNKCIEFGIKKDKNSIAILTRGKIHGNSKIDNLWKSQEVEMLAKAAYFWRYKSKREAYNLCTECLYWMFIGHPYELKHEMKEEIEKKIFYEEWKNICLKLLINLPSANLAICNWVKEIKNVFTKMEIPLPLIDDLTLDKLFKIKRSDKYNENFKSTPVKLFFEIRNEDSICKSSIHGVKGETFDAVLLYAPSIKGTTITRTGITKGSLDNEHNRAAYVAMTRPRKYLAVALQKPSKKSDLPLNRFPQDLWEYVEL